MTADQTPENKKLSRRSIREAVFKLIFISEFTSKEEMQQQMDIYFDGVGTELKELLNGGEPDSSDVAFINEKYGRVMAVLPEIDELLNKTSSGWKTSRMSKVDLSILRLAVYEILYDESIPVSVAINEAVELAKKFSGEDSGSFINGILGNISKNAEEEKN